MRLAQGGAAEQAIDEFLVRDDAVLLQPEQDVRLARHRPDFDLLCAADQARLMEYLDDVREIERRIQKVEASNTTGEPRELPGAPAGVVPTIPVTRSTSRSSCSAISPA